MDIRERIDDRLMMAVLIPGFGLTISHAVGLFGPLGPGDFAFWWGHLWFIAGAALIYGANRTLLFAGRRQATWFSRPVARLVLLATGILFGTVPTTVVMLQGWAWLSGIAVPRETVTLVGLTNTACVLFVTWLYETLFLIGERVDDQARLARVEAARTRAELDALRAQLDPHFLFNALNTLVALIDTRPKEAAAFVHHLARVYRGLLDTRDRTLVPLVDELDLARSYGELLQVRFGSALVVDFDAADDRRVVPGAVQVLLENAVRHNAIDPDAPLAVKVAVTGDGLVVEHPRRPRRPNPGAGVGLANLDALVHASTGKHLGVESGGIFRVIVPLAAP